ncbi:hypothetical protein CTheo_4849 [Ceratobasidium theobromae]|uniref:Uncharacterized protein n=1 Tax=Ceratobasidium theobromae TaxID=1582974 RepID=A0A5N5QJ10_9AGAM|nr:hypothetical protein CTheo_4849 [Ceratobasidium theobromae]
MESILSLNPYPMAFALCSDAAESDSDMDAPQLSDALTETENDTPPETPLRSTMMISAVDKCHSFDTKERFPEISNKSYSSNLDVPLIRQAGSPAIPPPAHVFEPLVVANPRPIRPAIHSFRSFGVEFDEEDGGYHSEREGRPANRPILPRFRSYHLVPNSDQGRSIPVKPKLTHRASSFLVGQPREHGPSPLSTPTQGSGSFHSKPPPPHGRPRHPPPMDAPPAINFDSSIDNYSKGPGFFIHDNTSNELVGEAHPDSSKSSLVNLLVDEAELSACVRKDRSNKSTGLGLGLPASLEGDTWRTPTAVPAQTNGQQLIINLSGMEILNQIIAECALACVSNCMKAPGIHAIQCDDSDMSPLVLPGPIITCRPSANPADGSSSDMADALLQALEMGMWAGGILGSLN